MSLPGIIFHIRKHTQSAQLAAEETKICEKHAVHKDYPKKYEDQTQHNVVLKNTISHLNQVSL